MKYLIIYWILINLIGFLSMWIDKRKAIKNRWRISERTLFAIAFLGGTIGSFIGMYTFHHKTKTPKFMIGIPLILLGQIALVCFLYSTFPKFLF